MDKEDLFLLIALILFTTAAFFGTVGVMLNPNASIGTSGRFILTGQAATLSINIIVKHIQELNPKLSSRRAYTLVKAAYDLSTKYSLSPYLVLAIIWQETAFKNVYGDHGKALGYCQLHQATFDWLQLYYPKLTNVSYKEIIRLPVLQVELIYMHLALLLKLNNNNIYMAISKYNGNTVADSRYTAQVIDKVERIKKWVQH